MRLKLVQLAVMGVLVLGLGVPVAFTQGPGGGFGRGGGFGGGGKRGGGGGFQMNPDVFFNMMAGKDKEGKQRDVIVVSEYEAPMWSRETTAQVRDKLNAYLSKRGISDGKMTREIYAGYFEEQRSSWGGGGKAGGGGEGGFGRGGGFGKGGEGGGWGKGGGEGWTRGEDKGGREEKRAAPPPAKENPGKGLDKRPVVFRYGKLPTKELPSWFVELDTDKDGQVGLYEWRAAKRATKEFRDYDLNGDGFITAEECIAVQKEADAKKDAATLTFVRANAEPGAEEAPGAGPSKGGPGGGTMG
ncbi:MAG: hypothetical protein K2W96_22660, partial [Gemmataceae bacterium]|nr:hypothetical protein [Gemmataceae bacterium]